MVPLVKVMSPTAKLEVALLVVKVRDRLVFADVSPSLTSAAVIVIVGDSGIVAPPEPESATPVDAIFIPK